MKIVVLGSTGATGKLVVEQALALGHEVSAFARNPADIKVQHPKLTIVQGDSSVLATVEKALVGADAVVSALGTRTRAKSTVRSDAARNVVAAMKKNGVRRVIWLSAAGVGDSLDQTKRASFVFGRIIIPLLLKDVYADMAASEVLIRQSGLENVVVRPVGLTDKPATKKVDATADLSAKVPGVGIPRADVAEFMLAQLTANTWLSQSPVIWS